MIPIRKANFTPTTDKVKLINIIITTASVNCPLI